MMSDGVKHSVMARTDDGTLLFWCPGCKRLHGVWVDTPNPVTGLQWKWNGSLANPTVTPSILVNRVPGEQFRCHSVIVDGVIEFCQDSEHEFAGKKILLPMEPLTQI